jgi:hypothetical protein
VNRFHDILLELGSCDEYDGDSIQHVVFMDGDQVVDRSLKLRQTSVALHAMDDLMTELPPTPLPLTLDSSCVDSNGSSAATITSTASATPVTTNGNHLATNGHCDDDVEANDDSIADPASDSDSNQGSLCSDEAYASNDPRSDEEESEYLDADTPCALFFTSVSLFS